MNKLVPATSLIVGALEISSLSLCLIITIGLVLTFRLQSITAQNQHNHDESQYEPRQNENSKSHHLTRERKPIHDTVPPGIEYVSSNHLTCKTPSTDWKEESHIRRFIINYNYCISRINEQSPQTGRLPRQ